jgi:hypothetical protein
MSIFEMYFRLGVDHILDFEGYDHLLFLIALSIVYPIKEWKKLLILITAFTIGHSTTLVMATLDFISVPTTLIEFLIPVTIFITALLNIFQKSEKAVGGAHGFKYAAALFFGLIHGMGFSNYLRSLLGSEDSLIMPLFSFNLGIEAGQILIVAGLMALCLLVVDLLGAKRREWNIIFSGAAMGVSLVLIFERFPW